MDQWHYDPSADLDSVEIEHWRTFPREPGPMIHGLRALGAVTLRCFLRLYHRFTIVGWNNLPVGRSFVLIANHSSHLDTLCMLAALPITRQHRAFPVAARDYFFVRSRWASFVAGVLNAVPFDRQFTPWRCLSVCAHLLQNPGNVLILFPEGTRSADGQPGEFKPGVALLAAGQDVPVIPCHLAGTHEAFPRGAWIPRPRAVRLTIGKPRLYAHLPATKESVKQISRELHEAVELLGRGEGDV